VHLEITGSRLLRPQETRQRLSPLRLNYENRRKNADLSVNSFWTMERANIERALARCHGKVYGKDGAARHEADDALVPTS